MSSGPMTIRRWTTIAALITIATVLLCWVVDEVLVMGNSQVRA
jgi:hypothetical protein